MGRARRRQTPRTSGHRQVRKDPGTHQPERSEERVAFKPPRVEGCCKPSLRSASGTDRARMRHCGALLRRLPARLFGFWIAQAATTVDLVLGVVKLLH